MLAYFFFHWKLANVHEGDYEQRLRDFHTALKAAPPEGFTESWSVALNGVPWANAGGSSYEDWYLVRNSGDLDPLNDAAITASRKVPHERAASGAAGGSAGLYRVRAGEMISAPRFTSWFEKPAGWSYGTFLEALQPAINAGALWQRQMALGPGEFCLHTSQPVPLPQGITAHSSELRAVFPDSA